MLRLAALLHDIGKPRTRRFEDGGGVSFHHHEVVGAKMARERLGLLKYSREITDAVCKLVELHLRFYGYGRGEWTDSAVRRYVRDAGTCCRGCTCWYAATARRATGARLPRRPRRTTSSRRASPCWPRRRSSGRIRPDLDGNEIMGLLGVPPGPLVGRAYTRCSSCGWSAGRCRSDEAAAELLAWAEAEGMR